MNTSAVGVAITMSIAGGCASPTEFTPIHEAYFWTDAALDYQQQRDPQAMKIQVIDGEYTILMTNDRRAPGTHDAVFMTLPSDCKKGRSYHLSFEDETLHYDGYADDYDLFVRSQWPTWAHIRILDETPDTIDARVLYYLTRTSADPSVPVSERQRRGLHRSQNIRFQRAQKTVSTTKADDGQ